MFSCIFRFDRLFFTACVVLCCSVQAVSCISGEVSPAVCDGYAIIPGDDVSGEDMRWADYLRSHLSPRAEGSGRLVPAEGGDKEDMFGIVVHIDTLMASNFAVKRQKRGVELTARSGQTMLWLQYQLMRSLGDEDPRIQASDLPPALVGLRDTSGRFTFSYRGLYTPMSQDPDLAGILSVDNIETGWGLWGHQCERVLGKDAPESVYATVGEKIYEGQFCFSAEETYRRLESYVIDNYGEGDIMPSRFVIAPADDDAVCQCAGCLAIGNTTKSATPAMVKLLNRLAARFPRHIFFTLGYLSTREAPPAAMPANTGVIVSAMELPFASGTERLGGGRKFTDLITAWKSVSPTVYVWDYTENFDDYLTPFPVLEILGRRLEYYSDRGVQGVFLNGSGYDYVPFDDMRTFVLSSLMINPKQSVERLMRRFFAEEYPLSGSLLADFCTKAEHRSAASKKPLNLYGGIREAESVWLDARVFVEFYDTLCKLLPAAQGSEQKRLHELLTALSYTRLEIARNHASGEYGFAERDGDRLRIKPEVGQWLAALEEYVLFPSMKHVSESELPIGDYIAAWRSSITDANMPRNLLLGEKLLPVSKPDELYEDLSVLTDGVQGLAAGYHYGWHISSCDLEVEIPVGVASAARRFEMSFLNFPRHRLYAPRSVEIYKDGELYKVLTPVSSPDSRRVTVASPVDLSGCGRITVKALRPEGGRVQLAADEINLIP